jgi:putative copper export protein
VRAHVLLAVVVLLALPAVAAGHAEVTGATNAGTGVTLALSSPAESEFLAVESAGKQAELLAATLDRNDRRLVRLGPAAGSIAATPAPGSVDIETYSRSALRENSPMTIRLLSVDGHVTRIRVTLSSEGTELSNDSSRGRPLAVVGDTLLVGALIGLIGLIAVRCGVLAPARRPPRFAEPDGWSGWSGRALSRGQGVWWTAWWAATSVGLLGAAFGFVAQLRALDISVGDAGPLLTETRWGVAWLVQVIAMSLAAALGAFTVHGPPDAERWWEWLPILPLGAAAISLAWAGHAGSGADAGLSIALDTLHTVASGVWLGGLVALLSVARGWATRPATTNGTHLAAAVVVRFSALAIACVATIMITGVYRGLEELGSLADLTRTGYGQALLAKLATVVVLLAGGVYNRTVLHPRLERAALGLTDTDRGAAERLRTSIRAELVVAAGVLAAVAILINLPPP